MKIMLPREIVDLIMSHKDFIEHVLPVAFPKQHALYSTHIEYINKIEYFCAEFPDMQTRVVRHVHKVQDKINHYHNIMMLQSSLMMLKIT